MSTCPACLAAVPEGAQRCPTCRVPFTLVGGAPTPGLSTGRSPRPLIPAPPLSRTPVAHPPPTLAMQPPPQPFAPPPPPVEEPSQPAYTAVSTYVPSPVTAEPAPWWRDRRVLIAAPIALIVVLATLFALTRGGPEIRQLRVPDVVGMDVLDAKNLLDAQGLVTPFAGYGTVASQDPPGGALVAPGAVVVLTIDRYPDPPAATKTPSRPASRNPTVPKR